MCIYRIQLTITQWYVNRYMYGSASTVTVDVCEIYRLNDLQFKLLNAFLLGGNKMYAVHS